MSEGLRSRRPRADAVRNRDAILAISRRIFGERPAAYVSMADIAREAKVGVGTVYRHFPSRRALLEAVFTDEVERVRAAASDRSGRSPGDSLTVWLHLFFDFARDRNDVATELISPDGLHTPLFRRDRTIFCEAGEPLLTEAQASGEFSTRLDIGQVLDALVWLARGQAEEQHVRPIVDTFLDGLRTSR